MSPNCHVCFIYFHLTAFIKCWFCLCNIFVCFNLISVPTTQVILNLDSKVILPHYLVYLPRSNICFMRKGLRNIKYKACLVSSNNHNTICKRMFTWLLNDLWLLMGSHASLWNCGENSARFMRTTNMYQACHFFFFSVAVVHASSLTHFSLLEFLSLPQKCCTGRYISVSLKMTQKESGRKKHIIGLRRVSAVEKKRLVIVQTDPLHWGA